ncbi:hypothetical protein UlMin_003610 [Ulmus minor]
MRLNLLDYNNRIFYFTIWKFDLKDLCIKVALANFILQPNGCCCCLCPLLRKAFRKIHIRLVREFKKVQWEGHQRRALLQRPCTCTLTAIHDAILEDVVHPAEIVGKRVRYRIDGSKIIKIKCDDLDMNEIRDIEFSSRSIMYAYFPHCGFISWRFVYNGTHINITHAALNL